jgi:hypothetical protein
MKPDTFLWPLSAWPTRMVVAMERVCEMEL